MNPHKQRDFSHMWQKEKWRVLKCQKDLTSIAGFKNGGGKMPRVGGLEEMKEAFG